MGGKGGDGGSSRYDDTFGPLLPPAPEGEEVIDLLQLQAFRGKPVGSMAYGIQKRVELGRALCIQPARAACRGGPRGSACCPWCRRRCR